MHFWMLWLTITALLVWLFIFLGPQGSDLGVPVFITMGVWILVGVIEAALECFNLTIFNVLASLFLLLTQAAHNAPR